MGRPDSARLVLLPGLICSDVVWAAQVRDLAKYAPLAIPDYGDADRLETMASGVLACAPARMSLAGHSMGARVALEMFRQAPERVERIALLDTGVHPPAPVEADKRMELVELGRRDGMPALVDAWLPPMVHPDRRGDTGLMGPLRQMCLDAGLAAFERGVHALLHRPEVRGLLARIRCPALVGVGSHDTWAPPAQHREIAMAIPGAVLDIYAGAGHMAPAERPDAVTDSLRRWLGRPVVESAA